VARCANIRPFPIFSSFSNCDGQWLPLALTLLLCVNITIFFIRWQRVKIAVHRPTPRHLKEKATTQQQHHNIMIAAAPMPFTTGSGMLEGTMDWLASLCLTHGPCFTKFASHGFPRVFLE